MQDMISFQNGGMMWGFPVGFFPTTSHHALLTFISRQADIPPQGHVMDMKGRYENYGARVGAPPLPGLLPNRFSN